MDDGKNRGNRGKGRDGDAALWDFVTRTVTPFADQASRILPGPAAPLPRKPPSWSAGVPEIRLKEAAFEDSGNNNSSREMDRRTAARLRQGKMTIEAVLDLHGLRQAEAQERLFGFLRESATAGRRCVLVITGKGTRDLGGEAGVLRRMLPVWLEMEPVSGLVLSASPARPKDGGGGAFYILLRRRRSGV